MQLTWWGHSTVTITDGGVSLLTDPVLGQRLAHLRRRAGVVPSGSATDVDGVLVSHLHADHFDVASLRRIDARAQLIVPRGGRGVLRHRAPELARRCLEVVPGDCTTVGHLRITATSAEHPGVRGPWSRHAGPALGFLVEARSAAGGVTAWFAGDTGLFDGMTELGEIDAALVPVGGWGPTLGLEHLDPERAVEAMRRSAPRLAVPIHYGTFWPIGMDRLRPELFQPPGEEFARLMAEAGLATHVAVLGHGGSVEVPARVPRT